MKRKNSRILSGLIFGALPVFAPQPGAAEVTAALEEALGREIPAELAALAPPGAREYDGPEGAFRVEVGEMDGAAPEEAFVLVLRPSRPATFLADASGKIVRKSVKLPGRADGLDAVFQPFAEGRSLVLVSGGEGAASALLAWNGKKLDTVWESGRPRAGESRWFELDDLNDDGVREVVTYQRAELDVASDDEIGETSTGSSAESLGPTSVLRLEGGQWREDSDLLDSLR
jgi:hypothetical protein